MLAHFTGPGTPKDLDELLARFWSDVREQVQRLENSLTKVSHIYHESVLGTGTDAQAEVESVNAHGHEFIKELCLSGATIEACEDSDAALEAADWTRCLSVGLASEKVSKMARDSLEESVQRRWGHFSEAIDRTLGDGEAGLCVLNENHRVQFPAGVQVFYVSPPSLNEVKRWMDDWIRTMMKRAADPDGEAPMEPDATSGEDVSAEGESQSADQEGDGQERTEHPEYPY